MKKQKMEVGQVCLYAVPTTRKMVTLHHPRAKVWYMFVTDLDKQQDNGTYPTIVRVPDRLQRSICISHGRIFSPLPSPSEKE